MIFIIFNNILYLCVFIWFLGVLMLRISQDVESEAAPCSPVTPTGSRVCAGERVNLKTCVHIEAPA